MRVDCTRRPDLLPVDDVMVPILHRRCSEGGKIRSGTGFGKALAPDVRPMGDPPQIAILLLLGAMFKQRCGGVKQRDGEQVEFWRIGACELFVDHDLVCERQARTAPFLWPVRCGQANLAARFKPGEDEGLEVFLARQLPFAPPFGIECDGQPIANFLAKSLLVANLGDDVEGAAHYAASSMSAIRSSSAMRVPNSTSLSFARFKYRCGRNSEVKPTPP